MNEMNIKSAKYTLDEAGTNNNGVLISIDNGNVFFVPLAPGNRHYDAIMKAVEAGELTIADAD